MLKVVLIDIDIDYEYMQKYDLFSILDQKIEFCSNLFNVKVLFKNITKSQSNHVHLFLHVSDLSDQDIVRFKFCVGEDHKRLNHSIRRFERIGTFLDFFWMSNIKKKKRRKSSKKRKR